MVDLENEGKLLKGLRISRGKAEYFVYFGEKKHRETREK